MHHTWLYLFKIYFFYQGRQEEESTAGGLSDNPNWGRMGEADNIDFDVGNFEQDFGELQDRLEMSEEEEGPEVRKNIFFLLQNFKQTLFFQDPPEDPDDDLSILDDEDDYASLLKAMSRKWYSAQLNHKVSATAAEAFWKIAKTYWPKIVQAKQSEEVEKSTPLFPNQRKKLDKQLCPEIHMEFGFLNVTTGEVETVNSMTAPLKDYERNPNYIKLYEEAHIKVNYLLVNIQHVGMLL